jgi:hypothetical protein
MPDGNVTTLVQQSGPSGGGLAVDANGSIYLAGGGENTVLTVSPAGAVAILAGTGERGSTDGPAAQAK